MLIDRAAHGKDRPCWVTQSLDICLRNIPVGPNVVIQFVRHVENKILYIDDMMMTC